MRHPVLRIKKGTSSYDDRPDTIIEERTAEKSEQRRASREIKRRPLALFRLRRGSLLPILILVLIVAVIMRVVPRPASRANIGGWHASLQARVVGDILYVGVGFTRLDRHGARDFQSFASVVFIAPDTGQQAETTGILEESRVALRAQMRYTGHEKTLRALVTIDGQSQTLFLSIRGP